jgi:hypothetical protein
MDGTEIIRRYTTRRDNRTSLDGLWKIIEQFIAPYRVDPFNTQQTGENAIDWRKREIFDSTAIDANSNLAAHMHGALTNSVVKWFTHQYKQKDLRKDQEAKAWLEEADAINYQSLQESTFDNEANEYYLDLTSFGSAAMMSEPDEDDTGDLAGIDYKTIPIDECYFDLDVKGHTINFYRELMWTRDQMIDKFGLDAVIRIDELREAKPDQTIRYKLIYCVYKRQDVTNFNPWVIAAPDLRPYGSKYIFVKTKETIGKEGGHHEAPVFFSKWRQVSGSMWGYSPSMIAIWDVLSLNQMDELIMVAGEKVLDPTILTTRKGVYGDIDLSAGGTVVVQDIDRSIKAFESAARFDVSAMNKQDLIRSIERIYFVNELQLKESPAMTATEVNARIQLMQRLLGPTFGYLRTGFLGPAIERNFRINFRYRKFPPLPPVLVQRQADLEIQYLGTLAKAQKAEESQSIGRVIQLGQVMSETFPGVLDNLSGDEALRAFAEIEGVPASIVRSQADVAAKRKQDAERAAKQQEVAMASAEGQAMQDTGKGVQEMQAAEQG